MTSMYCVVANTVRIQPDGSRLCAQVPTFFLLAATQGITSAEQACSIAAKVINPTDDPALLVHIAASAVDGPSQYATLDSPGQ